MKRFGLREAPQELVEADAARFDDGLVGTVIQHSGQLFEYETIRHYCRWFAGSDFGWKWTYGDAWFEGYWRDWQLYLGAHLAGGHIAPGIRSSVHMRCKAGWYRGRLFHWTPYVALDIDNRPGQAMSVADRYYAAVDALDCEPVVLRSPRHGLHVYAAVPTPMSVFGLVCTARSRQQALIPARLAQCGLIVAPGILEVRPSYTQTLRLPLSPGMVQLDPKTLVPLPSVSRVEEIARLVHAMDGQAVCRH